MDPFKYVDMAANAGMGLLLGEANDRRQINQQEKLNELQIQGQMKMSDYQMKQQYEMWLKTNYPAQIEQMRKAGLNPALMYGMGGGGGTTTGSSAANVTGAHAPAGGREAIDMMGMGLQYELLKAQKENIEADTKNKLGDAANKPIVGQQLQQQISESQKRIQEITATITNKHAQTELTKVNTHLANMDLALKEKTFDAVADRIEYETRMAYDALVSADQKAYIDRVTRNDVVKSIQQDAINKAIHGALMKAQTVKTGAEVQKIGSDIRLQEHQMNEIVQRIMRDWDKMSQENQRIMLEQMLVQDKTDPVAQMMNTLHSIIGGIIGGAATRGLGGGRTIIEGFKK